MHPTHVPIRVVTGAYILNSGLTKLKADEEAQEQMHGWASGVYPVFKDMKAGDFTKLLGYGEIGLGAMLLLPTVPSAVAGSALAAFGAGLMGMYLKTPSMTLEDGIRPSPEGVATAKDAWLVGAGLTLAMQSFLSGTKHAARSVADGVTGAASSVAHGVSGAVTGAVGSASSSASGGVKGLLSSAQHAREDLADALSDLADAMVRR